MIFLPKEIEPSPLTNMWPECSEYIFFRDRPLMICSFLLISHSHPLLQFEVGGSAEIPCFALFLIVFSANSDRFVLCMLYIICDANSSMKKRRNSFMLVSCYTESLYYRWYFLYNVIIKHYLYTSF